MVRKSPECFPTTPSTTPSYDCAGRNRVEASAQLVGDPAAGGGEEILFVQDRKALHHGQDRRCDGDHAVSTGLRFGSTDNIPYGAAVSCGR